MKGYRCDDGTVRLFRPDKVRPLSLPPLPALLTMIPSLASQNMARMNTVSRKDLRPDRLLGLTLSCESCRVLLESLFPSAASPPRRVSQLQLTCFSFRLSLQNFDGAELTSLIKKLIMIDSAWIPSEPGHSLYIRASRHPS